MNYFEKNHQSIKNWAEEDRPREKFVLKGRSSLSNAELLAILIRNGRASYSALDIAKDILSSVDHSLDDLATLSLAEFTKIDGIGEAKAITILSALELGRRRKGEKQKSKPQIKSSKAAFELMTPHLMDLMHEEFWIVVLSRANHVLRTIQISKGGVAGTVADPKLVFKLALQVEGACSLILVHNHPSGNIQPSQADIQLTKKMKKSGEFLDLPVLDHLIFSNHKYFSFADEGIL
ncbi:RadC family protein [Sediminitomix flava]|uniref:DNA replication and repair protein RadC n=1 Tax=Sediminitomix flava TaxID=379075 RepID=A0A316A1Y9_SEDFL|nr:DNA repair protein RadC [Sediminitomix flava]PWJ43707.1 DNA replication and repair protein RadC [Sediminitomix flava]